MAAKGRYLVALQEELKSRQLGALIRKHDRIYVFGHGASDKLVDGSVVECGRGQGQ